MHGALTGEVPVYFAAVPLSLLRPFSPDYDVERHPVGRAAVEALMQECAAGRYARAWVYERDNAFIVADDYVILAAARRGQPDYVPCWVLGRPISADVVDVQGPIDPHSVRRLLGLSHEGEPD
ncbi:MAG: hypothetical protein HUU22_03390 [Phycisphaerae bacterium]|nr:hypothetical protein [Phycisphaerae bacterium]